MRSGKTEDAIAPFHKAIVAAQQAHQVAVAPQRTELAGQIQLRLRFYEAELPYREENL